MNLEESLLSSYLDNAEASHVDISGEKDESIARTMLHNDSKVIHQIKAENSTKTHTPEVGRNDPCPCGSGKKYKLCHGK